MRPIATVAVSLVLLAAIDARASETSLYVDASAARKGDGSAARPFSRITDALERARLVRAGAAGGKAARDPIVIRVAPGEYVGVQGNGGPNRESFPIVLDVKLLELRGGSPAPRIRAMKPVEVEEALLAVIADDVKIRRLDFDGSSDAFDIGAFGIYIDRARNYSVRDVSVTRAGFGIYARLANGEIVGCHLTSNAAGTVVAAGNAAIGHRSSLRYEGNRADRNCISGLGLVSGLSPDLKPPRRSRATGDYVLPDAPSLPGALEAQIFDSDISDNDACGGAGIQMFFHVFSEVGQPGSIVADVHDNVIRDNAAHDVAINTHHDEPCPTTAPVRIRAKFARNVFSDDRSKNFFGFNFRHADYPCYVNGCTLDVTYEDGEMDGYSYDNPPGLGNTLTVNGEKIVGVER